MISPNGYQVRDELFEGRNSLIYRGIRHKDNLPVIIKILLVDTAHRAGMAEVATNVLDSGAGQRSGQGATFILELPAPG